MGKEFIFDVPKSVSVSHGRRPQFVTVNFGEAASALVYDIDEKGNIIPGTARDLRFDLPSEIVDAIAEAASLAAGGPDESGRVQDVAAVADQEAIIDVPATDP